MEKEFLYISSKVLPVILSKFDESEQKSVEGAYYEYLAEGVAYSIECAKHDGEEMLKDFIEFKINYELEKWQSMDKESILEELCPNERFEELLDISYSWFEKAKEIALSKAFLQDNQKEKIIKDLVNLSDSIKGISKEKIDKELSEAICDVNYCYGNTIMRSLRLSSIF